MKREFNPTSRLIRSACATAAFLAAVLFVSLIEGLVAHYSGRAHFAFSNPTVEGDRGSPRQVEERNGPRLTSRGSGRTDACQPG